LISLNNSSAASAILISMKISIDLDRLLRRSLVVIAVGGLAIGAAARIAGYGSLANQCWFAATVPVAAGLVYSIVRDTLRPGVWAWTRLRLCPCSGRSDSASRSPVWSSR
jgi:hypothetical protein